MLLASTAAMPPRLLRRAATRPAPAGTGRSLPAARRSPTVSRALSPVLKGRPRWHPRALRGIVRVEVRQGDQPRYCAHHGRRCHGSP